MCVAYNKYEGRTDLKWSQGEMIIVSNGSNIAKSGSRSAFFKAVEAIIIRWDAKVSYGEEVIDTSQRILP